MNEIIPMERVESKIYVIRGQRVMLDRDLAEFYGAKTFVLNQAVKRNIERFPADFMFQLNREESKALRSQIVILNGTAVGPKNSYRGRHSKYLPYAFTEQGLAMLSGVLHSQRAIQVNIAIMRAFVRLRQVLSDNKEIMKKIELLEKGYSTHDIEISGIIKLLKKLMEPVNTNVIGFNVR